MAQVEHYLKISVYVAASISIFSFIFLLFFYFKNKKKQQKNIQNNKGFLDKNKIRPTLGMVSYEKISKLPFKIEPFLLDSLLNFIYFNNLKEIFVWDSNKNFIYLEIKKWIAKDKKIELIQKNNWNFYPGKSFDCIILNDLKNEVPINEEKILEFFNSIKRPGAFFYFKQDKKNYRKFKNFLIRNLHFYEEIKKGRQKYLIVALKK